MAWYDHQYDMTWRKSNNKQIHTRQIRFVDMSAVQSFEFTKRQDSFIHHHRSCQLAVGLICEQLWLVAIEKSVIFSEFRATCEQRDKPSDASSPFNEQTALSVAQHSNVNEREIKNQVVFAAMKKSFASANAQDGKLYMVSREKEFPC